jgi:hypothetical protein
MILNTISMPYKARPIIKASKEETSIYIYIHFERHTKMIYGFETR